MKSGKNISRQYLVSIFAVCLASGIMLPFSGLINYHVVALILLVTVSVLAMSFDIFPVLIAAVLSSLLWNFLFIEPRFEFAIETTQDKVLFLTYFIIAAVNAALTYKIRKIEKEAREKQEKEKVLSLYNTLFNSLSHELQTPISTIIGATDTLRDSSTRLTDKNKTDLVDEISLASLRLNEQVANLLNMSRLETGHLHLKKDWCDIRELVYSVVNKFNNEKKAHLIKVNIPENFPLFFLDFGIMQQVLHNLVNNAVQHAGENLVISIEATCVAIVSGHLDEDTLASKREATEYNLIFIISDNGRGFPEIEIDRVFDKFYRLQNTKAGGTGLGLSIVKGFVEAHEGEIRLRNLQAPDGAEFRIEIPAKATYINSLKHE